MKTTTGTCTKPCVSPCEKILECQMGDVFGSVRVTLQIKKQISTVSKFLAFPSWMGDVHGAVRVTLPRILEGQSAVTCSASPSHDMFSVNKEIAQESSALLSSLRSQPAWMTCTELCASPLPRILEGAASPSHEMPSSDKEIVHESCQVLAHVHGAARVTLPMILEHG